MHTYSCEWRTEEDDDDVDPEDGDDDDIICSCNYIGSCTKCLQYNSEGQLAFNLILSCNNFRTKSVLTLAKFCVSAVKFMLPTAQCDFLHFLDANLS